MNECECYRWLSNDSVYELMCEPATIVVLCMAELCSPTSIITAGADRIDVQTSSLGYVRVYGTCYATHQ